MYVSLPHFSITPFLLVSSHLCSLLHNHLFVCVCAMLTYLVSFGWLQYLLPILIIPDVWIVVIPVKWYITNCIPKFLSKQEHQTLAFTQVTILHMPIPACETKTAGRGTYMYRTHYRDYMKYCRLRFKVKFYSISKAPYIPQG